jgi:N-acetylglucosaminyldiphosphoundecaprenol N-acetyl-beta-D-mannosaminyltransferase
MQLPEKAPVVGTSISMTTYDEVLDVLVDRPSDRATVVAVCNVHSVMSARRDPSLRRALESCDVATPDGVPLVWTLRKTANPGQQRVYGPDIMRRAMADDREPGLRHYVYGSTPETLEALQEAIAATTPHARIVGSFSPPFAPPTDASDTADAERIRTSGADVVWVGLGMPKQELWMHRMAPALPGVALVGVGAAFDFIAGTVPEAPEWMMKAGLEWLYRLSREPRRLWRRYLWNNPMFMVLVARQLLAEGRRARRT